MLKVLLVLSATDSSVIFFIFSGLIFYVDHLPGRQFI